MTEYLYTVSIQFADWSLGVEQASATDCRRALELALRQAESLQNRAPEAIEELVSGVKMVHIAEVRGVWDWYPGGGPSRSIPDVYGGLVIQTDLEAPVRG